jgi:hypothetical protein
VIAWESDEDMRRALWRRKLRFAVPLSLGGFGVGAWLGTAIGIAAFGGAISGMLPVGILGILIIWLFYYFGKRALVVLLIYLQGAIIRVLDVLDPDWRQ